MSHTPEPWEIHRSQTLIYIDGERWNIATINSADPNYEDNARLIVMAPKLLAALKGLLPAFSMDSDPEKGYAGEILAAKAAIAAAEPPGAGNPGG